MTDEQREAILNAMFDYWYYKVLNIMATEPYPEFDEALQLFIEELKND